MSEVTDFLERVRSSEKFSLVLKLLTIGMLGFSATLIPAGIAADHIIRMLDVAVTQSFDAREEAMELDINYREAELAKLDNKIVQNAIRLAITDDAGQKYACSGVAIQGESGLFIVTAGHCIVSENPGIQIRRPQFDEEYVAFEGATALMYDENYLGRSLETPMVSDLGLIYIPHGSYPGLSEEPPFFGENVGEGLSGLAFPGGEGHMIVYNNVQRSLLMDLVGHPSEIDFIAEISQGGGSGSGMYNGDGFLAALLVTRRPTLGQSLNPYSGVVEIGNRLFEMANRLLEKNPNIPLSDVKMFNIK